MVILAKFLSALGLSLLLGRVTSRWIHGPHWSRLTLSWPIIGALLLLLGAGLEVASSPLPANALQLSNTLTGQAALLRLLGGALLLLAELHPPLWALGPLGIGLAALGFGQVGAAPVSALGWLLGSLEALTAATWLSGLLALLLQPAPGRPTQQFGTLSTVSGGGLLLCLLAELWRLLAGKAGTQPLRLTLAELLLGAAALLLTFLSGSRQSGPSRVSQRARRQYVPNAKPSGLRLAGALLLLLTALWATRAAAS